VTFAPPHGDADMLCQRLLERDIVVSPRGGGVRVSPHGYNTADEIDTLVAAVAHLA
jgi:selenocysteine lyase/cysteine desulfurase